MYEGEGEASTRRVGLRLHSWCNEARAWSEALGVELKVQEFIQKQRHRQRQWHARDG